MTISNKKKSAKKKNNKKSKDNLPITVRPSTDKPHDHLTVIFGEDEILPAKNLDKGKKDTGGSEKISNLRKKSNPSWKRLLWFKTKRWISWGHGYKRYTARGYASMENIYFAWWVTVEHDKSVFVG